MIFHVFSLLTTIAYASRARQVSNQRRLVNDILDPKNYDNRVRPVTKISNAVTVVLRMNLYQILDVNEVNQNVQIYAWMTQMWTDQFLGWDAREYGNIDMAVLPYEEVWRPDTYLYNSVSMALEDSERYTNVVLRTNTSRSPPVAHVRFMYPAIFTFSCKLNIQYFPFDKQNCTMMFGSWTYDKTGINYFPESTKIMMEDYVENEEWRVINFKVFRHEFIYSCCPNPYVLVYAHLVIQRKPLFYMANLVIPTAIITLVAIVGFFMPASTSGERTEKVNLGITTLLAMSILLLMVSDQMPTTSNFIPLIGWFYLNIILLISVGTLMTSLVIWIHEKGNYGKHVPRAVRKVFFKCLARLLHVQAPPDLKSYWKSAVRAALKTKSSIHNQRPYANNDNSGTLVTLAKINRMNESDVSAIDLDHLIEGNTGVDDSTNDEIEMVEFAVKSRYESMRPSRLHSRVSGQSYISPHQRGVRLEWEYLANIIDRFLLVVFLTTVAVVTLGMMVVGAAVKEDENVTDM